MLFHAVPRRGASLEGCVTDVIFLSGLAPPLGLCRGGDLCGPYSALSQDGKLVVEDIPPVVWGLCFGKVGGVISCLFGPVPGVSSGGATVSPDPSCLSLQYLCCSSLCVGGLGSVCYIWSTSPVLFGAVQKPSLKPQTASNASVEARWLGKTP